jgi:hypothetical protein
VHCYLILLYNIYVYNLIEDEHEKFLESLKSLENIVEDTIGKELYIKEDDFFELFVLSKT